MKKLFNYGAMAIMTAILAVVVVACSKSPVDQIVGQIDKATAAVKSADSEDELQNAFKEIGEPTEGVDENYELTESDKETLKKSFEGLFKAMGEKAEELGEQNAAMGVALIGTIVNGVIDKSETIGDINKNLKNFGSM